MVTAADIPGRMIGEAEIEAGATRHQFEFAVHEHAPGADASVYRVRTRTGGRVRTDTLIALMMTNASFYHVPRVPPGQNSQSGIDTVTFEGVGYWNGRSRIASPRTPPGNLDSTATVSR